MKVFHGTSYENYKNIVKNGFHTESVTWLCSDANTLYCWSPDEIMEGFPNVSKEEAVDFAMRSAFENATITAALKGSCSNRVAVFELEVDEMAVSSDYSAPGMSGAICLYLDEANEALKNATVHFYEYNPFLRYFYLGGLVNSCTALNMENLLDKEIDFLMALNEKCNIEAVNPEIFESEIVETKKLSIR